MQYSQPISISAATSDLISSASLSLRTRLLSLYFSYSLSLSLATHLLPPNSSNAIKLYWLNFELTNWVNLYFWLRCFTIYSYCFRFACSCICYSCCCCCLCCYCCCCCWAFGAFVAPHLLLFSPPIRFVSSVVALAAAVVATVVVVLFYCLAKPVEHLFTHLWLPLLLSLPPSLSITL